MSNNLSPTTRALLDAAKHDGPSREKRAAMWTGITGGLVTHTPTRVEPSAKPQGSSAPGASTPGSGTSAASGSTAAAGKGAFWAGASMKGAFIGALFGSAVSIGVATFMLRAKTEPVSPAPAAPLVVTPAAIGNATANGSSPSNVQASNGAAATTIELPATNDTNAQSTGNSAGSSTSENASTQGANDSSRSAGTSRSSSHAAHAAKKESPASSESPDDMLSREVALVSQARRELLTGDATAALKTVRAARSLEARQLEPEEMSLEARALRQLGRDSEAERVESQLRTMYPGR